MQKNEQIIEPARLSDLEDMTAILNQAIAWGDATAITAPLKSSERVDWFKSHQTGKFALYVYREIDKVIGYVSISVYRSGRQAFANTAEVSYYIDFNHHRKGIASALLQKAFDHCLETGIKTLLAFLYNHNRPSIAFLKKYGFEEWGFLPKTAEVAGKELDHVIYGKRLS